MTVDKFTLNTREDVIIFESLLDKYIIAKTQLSLRHISLVKAYDCLQSRSDGGRIFSALLDIEITFLLLYLDLHTVGSTWNALFSKGKLEGGSILDSEVKFFGKMEIHRFNTAFVIRYRALWDKLMGIMILIYAPNDYDSFSSAKSKKRTFVKLAEKNQFAEPQFLKNLSDLLTKFDNSFRTSEAHGTGVLRKYSFKMEPFTQNPQIELFKFYNSVNEFIKNFLGGMFPNNATPNN